MQTRVGRWGGSAAIRLPKMAVESLGLHEGEPVSIEIEDGALVVRPSRPHYALEDLVDQAKGLKPPPAFDDAPVGDEAL